MGASFAVPANNLTCIVGPGGYTAGSGVLTLAAGQGANFPAINGGQFYRITVIQAAFAYSPAASLSNLTIFRASTLAVDTFTGVLAIEGTTDRNYASGDSVDVRVTAGTISDIQNQILNMQKSGSSVLSSSYDITATSVWQNTGLNVSLPAEGTYYVTYDVRSTIGPAVGASGSMWISIKLIQTDTGADVPNSVRLPVFCSDLLTAVLAPSAGNYQGQSAFSSLVTVTMACSVQVWAQRRGSLTSWNFSRIESNSDGYSTMTYSRIS